MESATGGNSNSQTKGPDEEQRGFNFARDLNFTDEQYEEALKRVGRHDSANMLLVALLDVSIDQQHKQSGEDKFDSLAAPQQNLLQDDLIQDLTAPNTSNIATTTSECDADLSNINAELFSCSSSGASSVGPSSLTTTNSQESLSRQQQHLIAFDSSLCSSDNSLDDVIHPHQTSQPSRLASVAGICSNLNSSSSTWTSSSTSLTGDLKPIYVDGSNVARTHGRDVTFSWLGIEICVNWFRSRRHLVRVLVPEDKIQKVQNHNDQAIISNLNKLNELIVTPSGCNDDAFIIKAAMEKSGIIVSNDQYREERRRNSAEMDQFVQSNRLPYAFVDDLFIPAEDPLGRSGPNLDEFLRVNTSRDQSNCLSHLQKLCRTRSHQASREVTGQRNYPRANNYLYRQNQLDYKSYRQTRSWQGSERPTTVIAARDILYDEQHQRQHPQFRTRRSFVYSPGSGHRPTQRQQPEPT